MPLDNNSKKVLLIAIAVILMVLSATGTNIFSLKVLGQTPLNDTVTLIAGSNVTLNQDTLNSTITINSLGGVGSDNSKVNKSGDTMTGNYNLSGINIAKTIWNNDRIGIQNSKYPKSTFLDIYSNSSGTQEAGVVIFSKGNISDINIYELVEFRYDKTNREFSYDTLAGGGGTVLPLNMYTQGNRNQLRLNINNTITMSSLSGSTGTVAVCTDSTGQLFRSTNATSNYLTC